MNVTFNAIRKAESLYSLSLEKSFNELTFFVIYRVVYFTKNKLGL
jgi:hypothetical protein